MDVVVEKTGACFRKLSVTIPADEVNAEFERAFKAVRRTAVIPGFRPGKAPPRVVESRYGHQVTHEVEDKLIRGSLPQALTEHDVPVVAPPAVDSHHPKRGEDFKYTALVEVQPEIELKTYEGFTVPEANAEVNDDDIATELDVLRQRAVQLVPVLDRDTIAEGDLVLTDYEATQGGIPVDGGSAQGVMLEMGRDDYLPGASEGLMGAQVPGRRSVPIDFPEDHTIEAWRGKGMTFNFDLKEIKKRELPELDDDFAADLGEETLDGLKTKIRQHLETRRGDEAEGQQREALLKALVAANPFEVPPSMVKEQVDRMIIDAARRVNEMMGGQFDLRDLDIEGLRAQNQDRAEHRVRSGLLLMEVSKAADVQVDDADLDAAVEDMAKEAGDEASQIRLHFANPKERENLRYKVLEDKTIALMLEKAKVVSVEEYAALNPDPENSPGEDAEEGSEA